MKGKLTRFYSENEPAEGKAGDIWFDTFDDNEPYQHNGNEWVPLRSGTVDPE